MLNATAMRVLACAKIASIVCAVAVLAHYAIFGNHDSATYPQAAELARVAQGRSRFARLPGSLHCRYNFWWPSLGAVGELIVRASIRGDTPAQAWQQWLSSDARKQGHVPKRGLAKRRFNGTLAAFRALWGLRQCPPGPCGRNGSPCPRQAEGFQCGGNIGDGYCCDAQGCFHDGCDNDGCFPYYAPCGTDEYNGRRCGQRGQCACTQSLWFQLWRRVMTM